ncbi:ABC transporter ATP-binding protein [Parageobacillus thermoglucosidasius]|uniref:Daunorubicin ABC transporter ATP-binding protein n=1 Tax=Parageobacillus thermoglucosidasius TaxID=1426 RepID=A0AAN0YM27_PARTM|nr:ATP-binding cassette domain-containing protein [Parageobacillus thermoglucosidasius]AEH49216.1 Sulfate-transporting ATPase [Parageobacillus thermoglucosidasius C56-YS93]ALF09594.1 daunorubicin ABC transporter ATP-binding protein [Parageobacillus thermoglucosidasius]ANZ29677.1 daunorubicin ABC transporter ATP-binding protein [Parageobacillus thermoglucosidasius]APM80416.1 daunorubicin ABC transporter ATP-binding protein [Parageobacillus thermoglucosidasius]KJX67965.1 daunorubicin ABC transpo
MNAIEVENLRKEFKSYSSRSGLVGAFRDLFTRNYKIIRAVNDISFTVKQGEMVGYIGENGAGKSTTIKMLTGILTPTSGKVIVNGMNPHKEREAFVRTIGVVFGQRSQLWWDIAVQESFRLLKKVYRVSDKDYNEHMNHVIETLDIGPLLDKPVRKLSLGQRMRCELAAALIHNPPLLFLDEPTIGLDVLVKLKIRQFLKEINEKYNTTILLTTHDISDIEALCERVIMLDEGKIIYDGSLQKLKETWGEGKQIQFTFVSEMSLDTLKELTDGLQVTWKQGEQANVWTAHAPSALLPEVISRVVNRYSIQDLNINEISTEEIIRNIYEEGVVHG